VRALELFEESLALFREQQVKPGIAQDLAGLGEVAQAQGDYVAARAWFEQSLTLWREIGSQQDIVQQLEQLETIARNQGDDMAAQAFHTDRMDLVEMPSPTS
jgi:tetratricopeptide (TPR) repeat protein